MSDAVGEAKTFANKIIEALAGIKSCISFITIDSGCKDFQGFAFLCNLIFELKEHIAKKTQDFSLNIWAVHPRR